jgi:hypothetical protein
MLPLIVQRNRWGVAPELSCFLRLIVVNFLIVLQARYQITVQNALQVLEFISQDICGWTPILRTPPTKSTAHITIVVGITVRISCFIIKVDGIPSYLDRMQPACEWLTKRWCALGKQWPCVCARSSDAYVLNDPVRLCNLLSFHTHRAARLCPTSGQSDAVRGRLGAESRRRREGFRATLQGARRCSRDLVLSEDLHVGSQQYRTI